MFRCSGVMVTPAVPKEDEDESKGLRRDAGTGMEETVVRRMVLRHAMVVVALDAE